MGFPCEVAGFDSLKVRLVVVSVHHHYHAHPGMDTAFPARHSFRKRGTAGCGASFSFAGFHELIRGTLGLRNKRSIRKHLGTFRGGIGIARQAIKRSDKSATEFLDPGEGVSFSALVFNRGLISLLEVEPDQLEVSLCRIQQWIEPPCTSDLVGLQFCDEVPNRVVPC
jgi:hypothetical protein